MAEGDKKQPERPTPEQIHEIANGFRTQLLLSQALHYAIQILEAVEPEELRDESAIEDMKFLYAHAFPLFRLIQEEVQD